MKKEYVLLQSEAIMGENLKIISFNCSVKKMVFFIIELKTPQQNGLVERNKGSLQEMAKTMLNGNSTPKHFWAEAMNIACYHQN